MNVHLSKSELLTAKPEIDDDCVVCDNCGRSERVLAASHCIHGETTIAKITRDQVAHGPMVFDDQQPHSSLRPFSAVKEQRILT